MRIDDSRRSDNVEDYRDQNTGGGGGGGGGRGPGMKIGIVGTLVAIAAAYFLGVDPSTVIGVMQATQSVTTSSAPAAAPTSGKPKDADGDFVAAILGDTEDTWGEIFKAGGAQYTQPKLVLFREEIQSGCGPANTGSGPFYCPADQKVYIDLAFYRELETQFKAPGDFAKAYVLAHEVGHHVQTLLGTSDKVRAAQERGSEEQKNQLQVMMELQADCYAGIWANHANRSRHILEQGDIEEALGAASAVGDDTIQKRMRGYVQPESFTHGSAQQRMTWFKRGIDSGALKDCDTFSAGR